MERVVVREFACCGVQHTGSRHSSPWRSWNCPRTTRQNKERELATMWPLFRQQQWRTTRRVSSFNDGVRMFMIATSVSFTSPLQSLDILLKGYPLYSSFPRADKITQFCSVVTFAEDVAFSAGNFPRGKGNFLFESCVLPLKHFYFSLLFMLCMSHHRHARWL